MIDIIDKVIKQDVCLQCILRSGCDFWYGRKTKYNYCECMTEEFVNGIHAAYRHFAGMSHEQAIEEIIEYVKTTKTNEY